MLRRRDSNAERGRPILSLPATNDAKPSFGIEKARGPRSIERGAIGACWRQWMSHEIRHEARRPLLDPAVGILRVDKCDGCKCLCSLHLTEIRPHQSEGRLSVDATSSAPRIDAFVVRRIDSSCFERSSAKTLQNLRNDTVARLRHADLNLPIVRPALLALGDSTALSIKEPRGPREKLTVQRLGYSTRENRLSH